MKKILCLIDTISFGGGAERQMIGLGKLLHERGYKVDIFAYHNQDAYDELHQNTNITTTSLDVKNNKWSKLLAVKRHIVNMGGYDWVIAYKDGPAIISCLLKLMGGKFRLIVSERNTNQLITHRDQIKFYLYRFANYVVPNSYSQANFIKNHFPKLENKIATITNFTDTSHFSPAESPLNDKLTILTVARIASQKNILNYLKAIYLLKQIGVANKIHFKWFGNIQSGEESYAEICFKKITELGLEDMIDFYPAEKGIVKQYQSCDIFCLPSNYEGFPNVVCEAMSCGKPILCSRVCDNPQIVQENVNGLLFDPSDVNSIYTTIMRMIEMPQSKLCEWGKNSRSISEALFSTSAFVQKYIDLIERK